MRPSACVWMMRGLACRISRPSGGQGLDTRGASGYFFDGFKGGMAKW